MNGGDLSTRNDLLTWLRRRLLAWFRGHARPLPWRATKDTYAIWVSEIMLQQTQVATVIPFYHHFLQSFPDLEALAQAKIEDVLRLWEGLGYYRRAKNLHKAAKILVSDFGGEMPNDPAVLRSLPGFGRYTVGAVLSQAFDRRLPILEANSLRVLCRLFAIEGDPRCSLVQKQLWNVAERILPRKHCGDFNQALMELGALICTSGIPKCDQCPLQKRCQAFQSGRQQELPQRAAPINVVAQDEVAVVLWRNKKLLLVQRPEQGRWAGMWEFPHESLAENESYEQAANRILNSLTGMQATIGQELTTIQHGIMHYRITMVCLEATHKRGSFRSDFYVQGQWLALKQIAAQPLSSPQRKLAKALLQPRQGKLF